MGDASSGGRNGMMAAYSMREIKEKSPMGQGVASRQQVRWAVFSARSAGGSAWPCKPVPTATIMYMSRPSTRTTNANYDDGVLCWGFIL